MALFRGLLGAFASAHRIQHVRYLDVGTGLGVMPRQLNDRTVFDRFVGDLTIVGRHLAYREIPLVTRLDIDAHPLPTFEWVHTCHGPSQYYEERFAELVWALEQTADTARNVTIDELNILDTDTLKSHLRRNDVNAVTCSFVLYQYDQPTQDAIIKVIVENLAKPGILLSMEPSHGLLRQGCKVNAFRDGDLRPRHVADVSDAHFMGTVTVQGAELDDLLGMPEGDYS